MEYLVLNICMFESEELEVLLNTKAREGWVVICDTISGLILARKSKKKPDDISRGRNVTYAGVVVKKAV